MNTYRIDILLTDPADNYEEYESHAFIGAASYVEAVKKALDYYGEDETISFSIKYVSDVPFIETIDKDLADTIEKEMI